MRNFVNDRMVSETEKAQRLVDTMTDRIQHFPYSFNEFVAVLENEGPWTSDFVKELRDLYRAKGGCVVEPSPDQNSEESDCDSKSECVVKPSLNKIVEESDCHSCSSGQPKSTDGQPGFVCPYCRECSIEQFFTKRVSKG